MHNNSLLFNNSMTSLPTHNCTATILWNYLNENVLLLNMDITVLWETLPGLKTSGSLKIKMSFKTELEFKYLDVTVDVQLIWSWYIRDRLMLDRWMLFMKEWSHRSHSDSVCLFLSSIPVVCYIHICLSQSNMHLTQQVISRAVSYTTS